MIIFQKKVKKIFFRKEYKISNLTDRMGMRLEGTVMKNIVNTNIRSEGITKGAIQVPADGQPIILLTDYPTIGGYPKIANVTSADYNLLIQKTPGEKIFFELIKLHEAEQLYKEHLNSISEIIKNIKEDKLTLLNKIPGTVLILLGALCLSFGGIIVKSFEGANLWQILFWRQTFFSIIVALYLLITFKKNFFKSFHASGLPGLIAGIFLGIGFSAYVFAMYHTTVANTLFIISTETNFFSIIWVYFFKGKN